MRIAGLQRLSLIDYPGKLACTIFLFGCDFKCGFCHNPELVLPEKIDNYYDMEKIFEFLLNKRKYLDGVCITGGEPLINGDLLTFLKRIKELGYDIKLDTNGTNPELLKKIVESSLVDYIAMDIKADKDNYDILTGVEVDLDKIEKSIKIIASFSEYEFRTTVVPSYHNEENLRKIGEWILALLGRKARKYAIQNFVPRENKLINSEFERIKSFEKDELEKFRQVVLDYFEEVEVR